MIPGYSIERSLYRTPYSGVDRGVQEGTGRAVVIKSFPGEVIPSQIAARLRYEHKLLLALQGRNARHVVRPVELYDRKAQVALVLEDVRGLSLRQLHEDKISLSLRQIIFVGLQVAEALEDVHRAGLVHKDINPSNIIYNPATGEVQLIDFGIAARVSQELQTVDNLHAIEGTLPYVSPEQTGKTNRLLDYRSDFYSLGVALYELMAGRAPFMADDITQTVHAILATLPQDLATVVADLPAVVGRLVHKLMAKAPDQRYQSAHGLVLDLQRCLQALDQNETVPDFELGSDDYREEFELPQKLYGRAHDCEELLTAYAEIETKKRSCVMISGPSGIGKTALVNELQRALVQRDGIFIAGKYDQLRRHIPFSAFGQAIAQLVRHVLRDDEETLSKWRRSLSDAMGNVGQALLEVAPALELLVGPQKPIPTLGPQETENRLLNLLQRFMRAVTRRQPMVLFLDDLQWADAGTLRFLAQLCAEPDSGAGLLLIGAYRDNEVPPMHPLHGTLKAIGQSATSLRMLQMAPVGMPEIQAFLADALHQSEAATHALAALTLQKTAGNPFFMRTFLVHLREHGLLAFDASQRAWQWDIQRIQSAAVADNVVALVTQRLHERTPQEQAVLGLAASIGAQFRLRVVSAILQMPAQQVAQHLEEALQAGILLPLSSAYRYASDGDLDGVYKFAHDRIQQAAYELLGAAERVVTHARIGSYLLAQDHSAMRLGDWLFETMQHLNRAASLCTDATEKAQRVHLNIDAALEARRAMSYSVAIDYLLAAQGYLPSEPWDSAYDDMRNIELEIATNEFLSGQPDKATARLDVVWKRSRTAAAKAEVQHRRLLAMTALARYRDAVAAGIEALAELGFHMPLQPSKAQVGVMLMRVRWALRGVDRSKVADLPESTHARINQINIILADAILSAYFLNEDAFAMHALVLAYLTFRHGLSNTSAYAMTAYIAVLQLTDNYRESEQFAIQCMRCLERFPQSRLRGAMIFTKVAFYDSLKLTPREYSTQLEDSYVVCNESGQPTYGAWSTGLSTAYLSYVQMPNSVAMMQQQMPYLQANNTSAFRLLSGHLQMCRCLMGLTASATDYDDGTFVMADAQAQADADPSDPSAAWFYVGRCIVQWLYGDMTAAVWAARKAWDMGVMSRTSDPKLYCFVAALALVGQARAEGRRRVRGAYWFWRLRHKLHRAADVGHICTGKAMLIDAEWAALRGDSLRAAALYERALPWLERSGYNIYIGMGYECAGRFFAGIGVPSAAAAHLRRACDAYRVWGAVGKARSLESEFAEFLHAPNEGVGVAMPMRGVTGPLTSQANTTGSLANVDLPAVLRASQALSAEVSVDKVVQRILQSLIEAAGATRAVLLTVQRDKAVVRADSALHGAPLPDSLLQYVLRTRETSVRDGDGVSSGSSGKRLSVLCAPIVHSGQLKALIYLENNLMSDVFSHEKLAAVQLLATQAAISLENAAAYEDLEKTVAERTEQLTEAHAKLLRMERESVETQMAGGFAHEMRNALVGAQMVLSGATTSDSDIERLHGELRQVLTEVFAQQPERLAKSLAVLTEQRTVFQDVTELTANSIERGLLLVHRILDYAEANAGVRGNEEVRLKQLVAEVAGELRQELEPDGIQLTLDIPDSVVLPLKRSHAHTIVRNLLSNARDAVADKTEGPRSIQVEAQVDARHCTLHVTDTGTGIADSERIFQPFYSTKGAKGTGLGLGMSKKLAELYGGSIRFTSAGPGTRFSVVLPKG